MKVALVNPNAKLPTRAHADDVGFDLYAPTNVTLYAGDTVNVDLGIQVELAPGWGWILFERGSQGKAGIFVIGPVGDPGYRGNIFVTLAALGIRGNDSVAAHYNAGERICQLVPIPSYSLDARQVDSSELTPSSRGDKRWGSSGK